MLTKFENKSWNIPDTTHNASQARPLLSHALESGEFDRLVDPRLERNYVESEMLQMIEIAAACVRHSSAKRPRMGQVFEFDSFMKQG